VNSADRAAAVLVDPATLAGGLRAAASAPTVLDVRWQLGGPPGRDGYLGGHIPGAAFVDLDAELCGPPGAGGRHPLPEPAALERILRAAGVRNDRLVVAYDGGDGMAAARLWWTLTWAGHPDVRVLDGGWPAWQAGGLPIETGEIRPDAGNFTVRPGHLPVLDAAEVADRARDGVLVDARTPQRYRGDIEPVDAVAGRIPNARNVPYAELVDDRGRLRSADALRARFARAGIVPGTRTGAYCGSGVTAAHTVLALYVAGVKDPALYVGSWSHWITDPTRPVATGAPSEEDSPA
jgi:thiosulfate/3-mercaptopyruvate sulfurtransferase